MVTLNTDIVKLVIVIAVFAAVGIGISYFHGIQSVEMAALNQDCDIQQTSCTTQFSNGSRVTFSFSPTPVKPVEFFNMQVKTDFPDVRSVQVDFHSLNMNMGYYRPDLQKQSAGLYEGKGVLSACSINVMQWEAIVMLETNEGIFAAPFQFAASGKVE